MTHTLLIVWHSRTGAALQMAQAAALGAREVIEAWTDGHDGGEPSSAPSLRVVMRTALDASAQDVLDADGFIFCAPENLAALSGEMKAFFDRCYYDVLDQIAGLPYALIVTAGSDGSGAARQATRICTGWRLQPVAEPLIACVHAQTTAAILAPKNLDEPTRKRAADVGGLVAGTLLLGA